MNATFSTIDTYKNGTLFDTDTHNSATSKKRVALKDVPIVDSDAVLY